MSKIIYFGVPKTRLRVRRLNEEQLAEQAAEDARRTGEWQFRSFHGGAVAHAYRHPASTEAALIVANPLGEVVVWMAKLPASNVTKGGAANKCLPGCRAIWDGRYSEVSQAQARKLLQEQHRLHFPQTVYERLMQDQF
jgi:hypothetical protein